MGAWRCAAWGDLGADLVWATGWNDGANFCTSGRCSACARLPVAPAAHGAKASTVIPWGGLRPWAWLEDSEAELGAAVALTPPGVPCLPVLVDRATGLTAEHVDRVASWLRSLLKAVFRRAPVGSPKPVLAEALLAHLTGDHLPSVSRSGAVQGRRRGHRAAHHPAHRPWQRQAGVRSWLRLPAGRRLGSSRPPSRGMQRQHR